MSKPDARKWVEAWLNQNQKVEVCLCDECMPNTINSLTALLTSFAKEERRAALDEAIEAVTYMHPVENSQQGAIAAIRALERME